MQPAYFQSFYVPRLFFPALIVTKAVRFVQVARHFPIHHDAYPTCVFSVRKLINIFRHVRLTIFIMTKAEYLKYKGGHFRVNGLFSVRFYVPPIAVVLEDTWPTVFSFPPVVFRYDESWLRSPCRACGLFSKLLCLPRVLFPLKDSVDLNTKNNCQTEKKKPCVISTPKTRT